MHAFSTPRLTRAAVLAAVVTGVGVLVPATAAVAANGPGTGTSSLGLTGGSLSIGVPNDHTITAAVGGYGVGILPDASWSDATGSGSGWKGSVAVSDLTYTGSWVNQGSAPALIAATSAGAFSDTQEGVQYTVTTATISAGAGTFTYTSNDTADGSGSGSAVASTSANVGTKGVTINFGTQAITSGSVYVIRVGTQSTTAFSLESTASSAGIAPAVGTTSPNPTLDLATTTVTGGGVGATAYGTAIPFVSAALNQGMGSYTVTPGARVQSDSNSWAATYTAGVLYTILTGP